MWLLMVICFDFFDAVFRWIFSRGIFSSSSSMLLLFRGISYILILFFAAINSLVWNAILSTTTTGEQEKNNNNVKCPLIPNPYANKHQSRRTVERKKDETSSVLLYLCQFVVFPPHWTPNGDENVPFSLYHFSSILMTQTRTWWSVFKVKRDKHLIATRCEINIQLNCHRSLAGLYILIFIVLPCLDVTCTCFQTFHSIFIYTYIFFSSSFFCFYLGFVRINYLWKEEEAEKNEQHKNIRNKFIQFNYTVILDASSMYDGDLCSVHTVCYAVERRTATTAATATTEAATATLEKWKTEEKKFNDNDMVDDEDGCEFIHVMPWYRSFSFYSEKETRCTNEDDASTERKQINEEKKLTQKYLYSMRTTISHYVVVCMHFIILSIDRSTDGKWSSIYCFIISVHGAVMISRHTYSCMNEAYVWSGDDASSSSSSSSSWRRQATATRRRLENICSRFNAQSACRPINKYVSICRRQKDQQQRKTGSWIDRERETAHWENVVVLKENWINNVNE